MVILVQKWKASTAATGDWPGDVSALMIAAGRIFDENDGTFNRYGFIFRCHRAHGLGDLRDAQHPLRRCHQRHLLPQGRQNAPHQDCGILTRRIGKRDGSRGLFEIDSGSASDGKIA